MRIAIMIASMMLAACAFEPTLIEYKPQLKNKMDVKNIAIVNIDHDTGGRFSAVLSSVLLKEGYEVYNRTSLSYLLTEHQFQSAMADPNTLVQMGKLVGIESGATGSLETRANSTHTVMGQSTCLLTDYVMSVTVIITNYSTGAVLYANLITESLQTNNCYGTGWYKITTAPRYKLSSTGGGAESILMNRIAERIAIDLRK